MTTPFDDIRQLVAVTMHLEIVRNIAVVPDFTLNDTTDTVIYIAIWELMRGDDGLYGHR